MSTLGKWLETDSTPQKHYGDAYTRLNALMSDLPEWGTPAMRKSVMFLQMLDYGTSWWAYALTDAKESDG